MAIVCAGAVFTSCSDDGKKVEPPMWRGSAGAIAWTSLPDRERGPHAEGGCLVHDGGGMRGVVSMPCDKVAYIEVRVPAPSAKSLFGWEFELANGDPVRVISKASVRGPDEEGRFLIGPFSDRPSKVRVSESYGLPDATGRRAARQVVMDVR